MFNGYSDETFEFFMAIRFNNNADFFHQNHDWYMRGVRGPSLRLAEALGETMGSIDPELERRPDRVVSRINRDTRYARDKSPYRDYLWLSFHRPDDDHFRHMSLYFDISTEGGGFGMGMYLVNRPLMNALRLEMLRDPGPLAAMLRDVNDVFEVEADLYRRMSVPAAVPEELRWLYPVRRIGFYRDIRDFGLLKSAALVDTLISGYERLAPLYHYFDALIPVEDGDLSKDPNEIKSERGSL